VRKKALPGKTQKKGRVFTICEIRRGSEADTEDTGKTGEENKNHKDQQMGREV